MQNGAQGGGVDCRSGGGVQHQGSMKEDSVTQILAYSLSPVSYIYPLI